MLGIDPCAINPGDLRHQVIIQAPDPAQCDQAGQPVPGGWTTILTTAANIRAALSKEQVQDGQLSAQTTQIITIRWPGSAIRIVSGQRVVFGDDTYLIQDVDNILHRNRVLKLTCLEIDGDSL